MNTEKLRRKIGPIVEGALGWRMPESIARRIDELSKSLPKECHYRRKANSAAAIQFDAG